MRKYDETPCEARGRNTDRDFARIRRTPLHFNTWTTINDIYRNPYVTRRHPTSAQELYGVIRMTSDDIVQVQYGFAEHDIYFRAPMGITDGVSGYHRRHKHRSTSTTVRPNGRESEYSATTAKDPLATPIKRPATLPPNEHMMETNKPYIPPYENVQ